MKKSICFAISLLALAFTPAFAQPTPAPPSPAFQQRVAAIPRTTPEPAAPSPGLTQFSLDFPGGTPAQLVKAIEKATGKPLNAIIPTEDADIQLPPLKMNDVVTPQLFAALAAASRKVVAVSGGVMMGNYNTVVTEYGFKTADGPVTDTSIWYFFAEKPSLPPVVSTDKVCRFYSLSTYLNHGFTVDDITTAIQTGWRMAGEIPPPELNYHKETKLLIAYGTPVELDIISKVLATIPEEKAYQTRANLDQMSGQIRQLQGQLDQTQTKLNQLVQQLSTPVKAPPVAPEEKSGK